MYLRERPLPQVHSLPASSVFRSRSSLGICRCWTTGSSKNIARRLRSIGDANIPFDDLRSLLLRLGFEERIRGSHHIYRKEGVEEKINLQREGSKAKTYQDRQVRAVIIRYRSVEEE